MAAIPQISDAEWEVMKAVWDGAPLTAGEVVERVATEQKWKPRTIKTLLNRLVKKGAVAMEPDGRRYIYRARVARDAVIRRETRSFLSRVFDGAAAPAIVHFLEHGQLTPDEIKRLRETLDREAKS
ncbi:MAG TPA: BlaI/MecI/CopY family transcriptional regulator [Tepidisphaeraceae bacterium]|jgi:BlaI family penicillinase repressor